MLRCHGFFTVTAILCLRSMMFFITVSIGNQAATVEKQAVLKVRTRILLENLGIELVCPNHFLTDDSGTRNRLGTGARQIWIPLCRLLATNGSGSYIWAYRNSNIDCNHKEAKSSKVPKYVLSERSRLSKYHSILLIFANAVQCVPVNYALSWFKIKHSIFRGFFGSALRIEFLEMV